MEGKPGVQNVASAEQDEVSLRQACTWTQASSSKKIQRKYQYKGLKITACLRSWGKFWTTRYKETKVWAHLLSHPSARPLDTPPHKELAHPTSAGEQAMEPVTCPLFSLPAATTGARIKPCLNFFSGL